MNKSTNTRTNNIYSAKNVFFGSIAYILILAYFPLSLFVSFDEMAFETVSIIAMAITAFAVFKLASSARPLIALITPAAIFFFLGGSFLPVASIFSLLGSVALLACVIYRAPSFAARVFPLLLTAALYLGCAIYTENYLISLVCVAFLPTGLILAFCLSKGVSRVATICAVSFGLLLPLAALFLAWLFLKHGGNVSVIPSAIEHARTLFAGMVKESIEQLEMLEITSDITELSTVAVSLVFNLLPAIIISSVNLISFFIQSFTASIVSVTEKDKDKLDALNEFKMSTVSAVVFIGFLILYAVFSDEAEAMLATAALNVIIILVPGLLFTAFAWLKRRTQSPNSSCFGIMLYFGAIMLLIRYTSYAVMIGAIFGSTLLIFNAIKSAMTQYKDQQK